MGVCLRREIFKGIEINSKQILILILILIIISQQAFVNWSMSERMRFWKHVRWIQLVWMSWSGFVGRGRLSSPL